MTKAPKITVKPIATLYGNGYAVFQGDKKLSIHLGPRAKERAKADAYFWRRIGLGADV